MSWKYLAARPSRTVEAWGCTIGGFSEYAAAPVHRLELPPPAVVIVLCCGEPVTLQPALNPGSSTAMSAFFAGLQVQAQCVAHSGINDCIEIQLPPLAAYRLFGGTVSESNRDTVDLLEVARCPVNTLLDQLRATNCWQQRLAAVDRFIAHGLCESKRCVPPELSWAWQILERSHGQASIGSLARTVGWSERHLINQCRAFMGVRPKAMARRLRFSYAANLVSTQPTGSLCMIAAEAGFSDQSHMTREFQFFSGLTPSSLRTARFEDLPGIPATALMNR